MVVDWPKDMVTRDCKRIIKAACVAEKVIGLLGKWCEVTRSLVELTTREFLDGFDICNVSTEDIVYTKEDERWLYD